jgi:hypothetical protein
LMELAMEFCEYSSRIQPRRRSPGYHRRADREWGNIKP